jgi:hypothetical protein
MKLVKETQKKAPQIKEREIGKEGSVSRRENFEEKFFRKEKQGKVDSSPTL